MATIVDSLRRSSININNISKSLNETKKSVSSVNDSVNNISKIIATNTRVKRELFDSSRIINIRREEASRRQQIEDQLESSKVSSSPVRGLAFAGRSEKGPLGRLLGFLGFTFAGWIVENLPTWIFMGKEFISRIQTFGRSMYNMVGNMQLIITSFGDVLKKSFNAIITLNFDEFSEGSVAQSFDELNLAVQSLGDDITKTFELFTTPLNKSVETGEEAPGLGEMRPETMFPSGGNLTPEEQALISVIKKREGTSGPGGYSKFFGGSQYGGDLSQKTVMEVAELQKKFLREGRGRYSGGVSAVVGAGQFKYPEQVVMAMGLDPNKERFTPELQNKMILFLARKRGIDPTKPLSKRDFEILNKEWSGLGPFYGQNKNTIEGTLKIYQQDLQTFRQSSSSVSTGVSVAPNQSLLPKLPPTDTLRGGVQRYGASRDGGRRHAGTDFDISGNEKFYSRIGGVVTKIDYEPGGYGNYVDIYNDQLKVYERIAEAKSVLVKRGQSIRPGQPVVQGESSTGVIHYEIRKNAGYGFQGTIDPLQFLANAKPTVSAQISTTPSRAAQPGAMTPQRKGSSIVIIDDTKPQQPQVSYPSQQPVSTPTIHESKLLNNFIKNKLLLDLAYL